MLVVVRHVEGFPRTRPSDEPATLPPFPPPRALTQSTRRESGLIGSFKVSCSDS